MARYLGSNCALCRREGTKLYLKGDRCFSNKCAVEKRPFPPGPHGQSGTFRRKVSDYASCVKSKRRAAFTAFWNANFGAISRKRRKLPKLPARRCCNSSNDVSIMSSIVWDLRSAASKRANSFCTGILWSTANRSTWRRTCSKPAM
jgi:hypothetical protein